MPAVMSGRQFQPLGSSLGQRARMDGPHPAESLEPIQELRGPSPRAAWPRTESAQGCRVGQTLGMVGPRRAGGAMLVNECDDLSMFLLKPSSASHKWNNQV